MVHRLLLIFPVLLSPPVLFSADIDACYDVLPTVREHLHGIFQRTTVMIAIIRKHLADKYGAHVAIWYKHIGNSKFAVRLSADRIKGGFNVLQLDQYPELCQIL
jgi:hypothetical protein